MTLLHIGLFASVVGIVAAFQLYVSFRIAFCNGYTARQKLAQILMIWVVPVFGAIILNSFLAGDAAAPRKSNAKFIPGGGDNPPGMQ